jgi:hypothetical protein
MFLDQVSTQLAQRPAAIGQPDLAGRLVGQAHDFVNLGRGEPGRRSRWPQLLHGADPGLFKGVQIHVDRVDVYALGVGNRQRTQSHPVQKQRFGSALLMPIRQASEPIAQLSDFSGRGSMDFH